MYDELRNSIKVDPQFQDKYERVIAAGMKILFDQQTNPKIMEMVGDPATPQGVASAMVQVMKIIESQSKGFPQIIVMPAAAYLLTQVVQMLEESGEQVNADFLGEAFIEMTKQIMVSAGATPDKMKEFLARGQQQQQPAPERQPGLVEGAAA